MNKNAYGLTECLLSLMILLLCASLLYGGIYALYAQKDAAINEQINKEWFHSD